MPDPQPGPDEVLIEVVASAVNRADLLQRGGLRAQVEARRSGGPTVTGANTAYSPIVTA